MRITARWMGIAVAAALAIAGCGNKKKPASDKQPDPGTKDPGSKDPAPVPTCADQVKELGAWLATLSAEGDAILLGTPANLVPIQQPAGWLPHAPVVVMAADGTVVNGEMISDPRATVTLVKRALQAERARAADTGMPTDQLLIAIDEDVSWHSIVDVAAAAASEGYVKLVFVFEGASKLTEPARSSIDAELAERANPTDKAALLAADVSANGGLPGKVYGNCKPVLDMLPTLADLDRKTRSEKVAAELPKLIESCNCQVELPAVYSLHYAWQGRDTSPPLTGVALELAPAGAKEPALITAGPHAPWQVAYKLIVDAASADNPVPVRLKPAAE